MRIIKLNDVNNVADGVCGRFARVGFEGLSNPEKVFFCVWSLQGEVCNGGLDQYYFNDSGDYAAEAVTALKEIGELGAAEILGRANAYFDPSGPSRDRGKRQAQLELLSDTDHAGLGRLSEQLRLNLERIDIGKLIERYLDAFSCQSR